MGVGSTYQERPLPDHGTAKEKQVHQKTSRLVENAAMRRLAALLLAPLLATLAAAQAVHVVDPSGSGDFTGIQAAVNAAASGDTILIKSGHYYGRTVIDGKGLKVVAELGATDVEVIGGITVRNLAAGEVVVLDPQF